MIQFCLRGTSRSKLNYKILSLIKIVVSPMIQFSLEGNSGNEQNYKILSLIKINLKVKRKKIVS